VNTEAGQYIQIPRPTYYHFWILIVSFSGRLLQVGQAGSLIALPKNKLFIYLFKFTQYSVIAIKEVNRYYREYKEEPSHYKHYLAKSTHTNITRCQWRWDTQQILYKKIILLKTKKGIHNINS